jgi:hypothetical protein
MEADVGPSPTRDCHSLASNRVQMVLEMDITQTCRSWKEADEPSTAGVDLPHGPVGAKETVSKCVPEVSVEPAAGV